MLTPQHKLGNQSTNKRDIETGIIPLINIVFLLLIFFIISGTDQFFNVDLSASTISSTHPKNIAEHFYITVKQNGDLIINKEDISIDTLSKILGSVSRKKTIVIAIDKHTKASEFDPILNILNVNKFNNIKLAISENEKGRQ